MFEGPPEFDLVVIGGGIVGTGIARDAALRGLTVALFEKDDFGGGTTSRSTRLIHGGLRYLEHMDFGLVHEALRERRLLVKNAPHLVDPVPFLFPVYRGVGRPWLMLWAGMVLYDILSFRKRLPHHQVLGASHCLELESALRAEGLRGGFIFYDAQCRYPERLCVENLLDAESEGAHVANHAAVVGLETNDGRVAGVRVRDERSGEERTVSARAVVNAAGPWVDEVLENLGVGGPKWLIRSKGIHLVTKRFTHHALIMNSADGERVFFAIPWAGYTLVGTTDTAYDGDNDAVEASDEDVDYLIRETRRIMDIDLTRDDILFTTAGLRALPHREDKDVGSITRRHVFVDHAAEDGPHGLFSVVGGKITTYRDIARDVVDRVGRAMEWRLGPSPTRKRPLPGASKDWPRMRAHLIRDGQDVGLSDDSAAHLADHYGIRAHRVFDRARDDPALRTALAAGRPEILAEVDVAVEDEWARSVEDVLLRRLPIGLAEGVGLPALDLVADRMAHLLEWDEGRTETEKASYRDRVTRMGPLDLEGTSTPIV